MPDSLTASLPNRPRVRSSVVAALAALAALTSLPASAAPWAATHVIQGTFAASSPPEPPLVAMNASGEAVYAWNATGAVRMAERLPSGAWTASKGVPGGSTGAGPVAVAIGRGGLVAVALTTVATRYVPSKMLVAIRPAGAGFLPAAEVSPGAVAGTLKLGIDCAGSITLLWSNAVGVYASTLPGSAAPPGACNGAPGSGPWSAPVQVSNGHVGAAWPELAVNDAGAALAVWQEGAPGNPSSIVAAARDAGGSWLAAQTVSAPAGQPTWSPKPALDAAGNAAVGYIDGMAMVVATRPASGAWSVQAPVSGAQQVRSPALAMSEAGDILAAWQAYDPVSGATSIWRRLWRAGAWSTATRLSGRNDAADLPSAAFSGDGSLAVVSWTDDTALVARAAQWQGGAWSTQSLGSSCWGGSVPVAAGGGKAAAGWARTVGGNPNAAQLVGRGTP